MKRARPGSPNLEGWKTLRLLVAIATATEPATAASATGRTLFARAGDVDREVAAVERRAVQGVDGLLCLLGRAHRNEAEPARFARNAVHHQVGLDNRAVRREGVLQIVLRGVEGKISNKQFCTHAMPYCPTNAALTRLFPTIGFQIITEPSSPEDLPCRGIDKLSNSAAKMDHSEGIAILIFKNVFVRTDRRTFGANLLQPFRLPALAALCQRRRTAQAHPPGGNTPVSSHPDRCPSPPQQPRELLQRGGIRLSRRNHEFPELKVDADDI